MNASETFCNTVKSFGLSSHRGYLAANGACVDDPSQKGKLQDIFALARTQLFNLVKETQIEQAAYHRELLDALILNTTALSVRYQEKVGYLACKIFSKEAKQTLNEADLLISEARAANQLLAKLKDASGVVVQVDDFEETFSRFLGESWNKNIALIEQASEVNSPLSPLLKDIISWTTKRSVRWLTQPFNNKFPVDRDELYRLLPHLDFHSISASALQKIKDHHIIIKAELSSRYWKQLAHAMPKLGSAFIHNRLGITGNFLMRTSVLMDHYRSEAELTRLREALFNHTFPRNLLYPHSFMTLLEADEEGLLTNEWMIGFNERNRMFCEDLQSGRSEFREEDYAKKAGVFVLLENRRHAFSTHQEACDVFGALLNFKNNPAINFPIDSDIKPELLSSLLVIYEWLLKADRQSCNTFDEWFPSIADYLHTADRKSHSPSILPSQKALLFVNRQNQLSQNERILLINALGIDISFPKAPEKPMMTSLLKLSYEGDQVLLEHIPYLFYLKQHLLEKNGSKLILTRNSPLVLKIIYGLMGNHLQDNTYTEDEQILLASSKEGIRKSSREFSLSRWAPIAIWNRAIQRNYSGRPAIDDKWIRSFKAPNYASEIDFSDTLVSPEALSSFQKNHPTIRLKYRNSIIPGKKLLAMNNGAYELQVPGGVRNVHESLIRQVALKDPILESSEVDAFLEYCYTHQISSASDHLLGYLWIKAQMQNWEGIGEYCFARLISSIEPSNLLKRARLAHEHPLFAPLRVYCARYSLAHCLNGGAHHDQFDEREIKELTDFARGVFEPASMPALPPFTPVDLSSILPPNQKVLCADNEEVLINLVFLSLHSGYFKGLLNYRSTSKKPLQIQGIQAEGLLSIPAKVLVWVDHFARTNRLQEILESRDLFQLCCAAHYLEMPALKIALAERIRPITNSYEYGTYSYYAYGTNSYDEYNSYIRPSYSSLRQLMLRLVDAIPSSPEVNFDELQEMVSKLEL